MRAVRPSLLLLLIAVLTVAARDRQNRQSNYDTRSPQAYYKRPSQPQQSYYQQRPSRQSSYRQRQPNYYQQPAAQPAYYQQPAAQPAYYQQPAAQPAYYQQPAAQPAYYQQPAAQPAYYQQPAAQPEYYQQPAAQPAYYKKPKKEKGQDLSKVPGRAGVDYPLYHTVPETSFHCDNVPTRPGIYANVEAGCQAYHVCHDGREGHQGASFLCPNGTLFNQHEFSCDWWYNVNCADAPKLYSLNADPLTNPYSPKPKKEEEKAIGPDYYQP